MESSISIFKVLLLASRQTPKLEDHSWSGCPRMLNIFTANFHIWRPIRNLRERAVPTDGFVSITVQNLIFSYYVEIHKKTITKNRIGVAPLSEKNQMDGTLDLAESAGLEVWEIKSQIKKSLREFRR